jgi:hypothetical protein
MLFKGGVTVFSLLVGMCSSAGAWSVPLPSPGPVPQEAPERGSAEKNNDDQECKQPVCYAGDNGDQSCYVCEYGKASSHVVCTSKGSKKDKNYYEAQDLNKSRNECPAPSGERNKYQDQTPKK